MRIVVIGPGALGLLLAALLGRAGHDLWLLDQHPERAANLAARGVWLEENGRTMRVKVKATTEPAVIGAADLILLCVKAAAVVKGLAKATPLLTPASLLVAFQNGISHLRACQQLLASDAWAVGTTALGATLIAQERVRHGGGGMTWLGFLGSPSRGARKLGAGAAETFCRAGIPSQLVEDMQGPLWRKLLVNVGINALTALHGCPNGQLYHLPPLRKQLEQAVKEAATVARAKGIDVGGDPVADVLAVCLATRDNISSMLQDVRRRRPTEIDAINGELVAEAHRLGVAVPVNEELVRAVKRRELEYL
jgi:2-dehydropantoate 2-reductase